MKRIKSITLMLGLLMIISILSPIGANAEWRKSNNLYYYVENNNYCKGWKNINNNWYYFSLSDGSLYRDGLDSVDGKIYYFGVNGAIKTGWIYIYSTTKYAGWHYFYSDGSMAMNTIIDNCYLDENGTWNQSVQTDMQGTWRVILTNNQTYDITITDNKIDNKPYVILKINSDSVVIRAHDGDQYIDYLVKVNNNKIILYASEIDNEQYFEIGEGNKIY